MINLRYQKTMEERKALLESTKIAYIKALSEVDDLKAEVVKSIRGESSFSQELLSSLIVEAERKANVLRVRAEKEEAAVKEGEALLARLRAQYTDLVSWADMYGAANIETKKVIVGRLIRRIEVRRGYELHIDFAIDYEQFCSGLDVPGETA